MDKMKKEQWIEAINAEQTSLEDLEVFNEVTREEVKAMMREGIHPQRMPARLILVRKPDPQERNGWKPKARVVCCGNFEE
eukprot:9992680-Prorocentrum_lima.AAC.1